MSLQALPARRAGLGTHRLPAHLLCASRTQLALRFGREAKLGSGYFATQRILSDKKINQAWLCGRREAKDAWTLT